MNSQLNEIWQLTLSELSKELNKPSFETWFNLTKPVSLENSCLIIEVPNDFTKEWFETRYRGQIIKALKAVTANDHKVNFVIASEFNEITDQIPAEHHFQPRA
jgi:chromosomal replication initiator protein